VNVAAEFPEPEEPEADDQAPLTPAEVEEMVRLLLEADGRRCGA